MSHRSCIVFLLLGLPVVLFAQSAKLSGRVLSSAEQAPVSGADIYLNETGRLTQTDTQGRFEFTDLKKRKYTLVAFAEGFVTKEVFVSTPYGEETKLILELDSLQVRLSTVEVSGDKEEGENFSLSSLRNVEGTGIFASRKTEVIELENLPANLATNNPRQVFKGIAGLNIWENDGAGLQLGIGARGLDPNRTSNFNTRQNGYDISADALGYPESYYTPPTQALRRIEIVRGAASLQFGPQFGGLLNFIFKEGPSDKTFEFTSENTVGSFNFFSTFNSIGGSKDGWNYYAFFQHKEGDGWRENSGFNQNTAYAQISKKIGKKWNLRAEFTHMNYLAQQPGGLQDFEFRQDPRQSKRDRNWFKVDWNLAALAADYQISDKTKLNSRSFFLAAKRQALGELGPINRPDPLRERDLISGEYLNFGHETRLITRYDLRGKPATLLLGFRYYQGLTNNRQGDANDSAGPDFEFLNPDDLERSEYRFPSRNASLFAEHLLNLSRKWSITPGIRFEFIRTASNGYYKQRVFSGGEVIFEQKIEQGRSNERTFALLGLGSSYRLSDQAELYANYSQNYRSINFSDLAVVNPNLVIDSLLRDENGFNADLGIRGSFFDNLLRLDGSLFYLRYQNRIGISEIIVQDPLVVEKAVAYRTNIGDARMLGLEAFIELNAAKVLFPEKKEVGLSLFLNGSMINGKYLSGASFFEGNKVELIPPYSLKTGINFRWKNLRAGYQFSRVEQHFTDASNAEFVVDATRGLIPAYSVHDLSLSYTYKKYSLQLSCNNLLDARYFTRRAPAYPGPGIIPAEGRSFFVGFSFRL